MTKVFIRKSTYDYKELKPIVFEILDSTIGKLELAGKKVLIKPNLLCPAVPEQAILTHHTIIKATVEYVLEKNGRPTVSDSNAVGSFEKIIKQGGIESALSGLDVELKPLKNSIKIDTGDPVIKSIELSKDVLEADVIINLPKLKTHSQMRMTLGIKNLFGCVVGLRKPEWHLRVGVDRELFAKLLVLIYKTINPAVTIIDGILAMEGEGPGTSGTPREIGVILGSTNALALDMTVARMVGLKPEAVLTTKAALSMGLDGTSSINGELPLVKNFKSPELTETMFGPRAAMGYVRRHLIRRPVSEKELCKLCGECWEYCPAGAIEKNQKRLKFDYDKCIRCYCCLEVCPHGALSTKEPLAGRILKKLRPD